MIFPINTDAPIYFRPWGTAGLIVLNALVFLLTCLQPGLVESWALPHGQGLTPLAWLSSNFVHGGILHLAGNMVFLWGFGLIVEGKLGWHRFVPLYLLIGGMECAVEQMLFPHWTGFSFGASAAIFGLMAISLVWAPRNELTVFYWFFMRVGLFDLPILWFALLTFAKSLFFAGFLAGSEAELLHLLGAIIGTGVALWLLLRQQVDCEGWDLVSVMMGRRPSADATFSWEHQADLERRKSRRIARRRRRSKPVESGEQVSPSDPQRFHQLVQQEKIHAAKLELARLRQWNPEFQPEPQELLSLGRGLRKMREWTACVEMYEELLRRRPDFSLGRLELAEVLVLIQERPGAARRVLAACDSGVLSPQQSSRLQQLEQQIEAMIADGVIELEGQAW